VFRAGRTHIIPIGAYDSARLANLGLGHRAIDAGGGYTYVNPRAGHEFSAGAGFTFNLENPNTNYESRIDFHLVWGASQFLTKQLHRAYRPQVPAGLRRKQIGRSGGPVQIARLGVGTQIGYIFRSGITRDT
jgi:hypothetical protein